ncbi:hypothetical protein ACFPYJ_00105 [Paenibacillus solisilvae]|uniref:PepSY domain-containing protein n=1 Tax=Paenibacillus solisilvae TaxID=2486751 RepID=A0ABW0VQF1_9BACL
MLRRGILIFLILISCIIVKSKAKAFTNPGITLLDAYQIGLEEARNWDAQANLTLITSVGDTGSTPPSTLGNDGRREVWNLLFGNGQRNESLIINIKKGKIGITQTVKEDIQDFEIIPQSELILDSTDMVQIAIKYGVRPGEGWAKGYHFNVRKDHQALFLGVIGQNKYGKMTTLYMDKTGKVLGSETKNEGNEIAHTP